MITAIPLLQIEPSIAKKMYDQNSSKHRVCPTFMALEQKFTMVDKFTIVELTLYNCHYHGLAACNPKDKRKFISGLYLAYHRAFENVIKSMRWR